jgi:hypothetical protein
MVTVGCCDKMLSKGWLGGRSLLGTNLKINSLRMLFVKWKGNFNVGLHGMNSGAYMMRLVGKA